MKNRGILTIISGFSGVGKGTLVNNLLKQYNNYALSISATTRAIRPGETEGISYFYLSKEDISGKVDSTVQKTSSPYKVSKSELVYEGTRHLIFE